MRNTITHTTLTGHRIDLEDPRPDVVAFLERLEAMVADPSATEDDLIAVAYGRDNPVLDQSVFPGRGAVTPAVLADPAYRIVTDLLFRKRVAQDKVDVEKMAAEYTLSVAEAAARLGVHENAVRQAIAAQRLPSWLKGGRHFLHPRSVDAFQIAPRGPRAQEERQAREASEAAGRALLVCVGSADGASLRIAPRPELEHQQKAGPHMVTGRIPGDWKRLAVLTNGPEKARLYVIEQGADAKEDAIHIGPLYVRGRFVIVERVNNPRAARERFEALSKGGGGRSDS